MIPVFVYASWVFPVKPCRAQFALEGRGFVIKLLPQVVVNNTIFRSYESTSSTLHIVLEVLHNASDPLSSVCTSMVTMTGVSLVPLRDVLSGSPSAVSRSLCIVSERCLHLWHGPHCNNSPSSPQSHQRLHHLCLPHWLRHPLQPLT